MANSCKYYKQRREMSYDGVTWIPLDEYRKGDLVPGASSDCSSPTPSLYRWVQTDNTICVENTNATYTKYYVYKKQQQVNGQWVDAYPAETKPDGYPLGTYSTLEECEFANLYLTLVAVESGSFSFEQSLAVTGGTMQYTLDSGQTWVTLPSGESTPTVNAGQKVMWKGTLRIEQQGSVLRGIGLFDSTNKFNVEGNIMSLIYGDDFIGKTDLSDIPIVFNNLFYDASRLISAENLQLPATTLSEYCYSHMFQGCTSLTTPPKVIPADTLAKGCCLMMFESCINLTTAPELPATTFEYSCCYHMFSRCTSLTTAPEIHATSVGQQSCDGMFSECTSLVTPPSVLPATYLNPSVYVTGSRSCYANMFYGCTSLTTAPELPATTLSIGCYMVMFSGCTSLTTAPELLATTLTRSCYSHMFDGCTSLNYIKCLATDISANDCTSNWVQNVSSTGTFTKAASMSSWTTGTSGIPNNWTVQNA